MALLTERDAKRVDVLTEDIRIASERARLALGQARWGVMADACHEAATCYQALARIANRMHERSGGTNR